MEVPVEAEGLFGAQLPQIEAYVELLAGSAVEWGLIGPREVPRLWDRHVLNCGVLGSLVPAGVAVADVGSGAGLPGLVLAIARPDLSVCLVEPLLRRTNWLRMAVDGLGLSNVELVRSRAAEVAAAGRSFDVVTARAVAALPQLAGWCLPLVRPDGLFLALKGDSVAEELASAEPVLRSLGAVSWDVESVGGDVLSSPARVVRVVAGKPETARGPAARSGKGRSKSGRKRPRHP